MVRLLFKQKLFSWFDSYHIFYENGDVAFNVKGQMAWGHLLNVYDAAGQKLGHIKERVFTFLPKFEIYLNEKHVGTISREFTMFRPKYNIDFNGWKVEGDFLEWNYEARYKGGLVMTAQKKLWNFSDTYQVEVNDPQNVLCALMVVLAIDAANCSTGK